MIIKANIYDGHGAKIDLVISKIESCCEVNHNGKVGVKVSLTSGAEVTIEGYISDFREQLEGENSKSIDALYSQLSSKIDLHIDDKELLLGFLGIDKNDVYQKGTFFIDTAKIKRLIKGSE